MKTYKLVCFLAVVALAFSFCSCEIRKPPESRLQTTTSATAVDDKDAKTFTEFFKDKAFAETVAMCLDKSENEMVIFSELAKYDGTIQLSASSKVKSIKGIGYLKNITGFSSTKNDLKVIPEDFCKLKKLKIIDLCKANKLEKLPKNLGNLKNLEYFRLNSTAVKELPESITKLKKLKYLNISETRITKLPKNIGNLEKLQILSMENTSIKNLPESISNLKNLIALDCREAEVRNLPENLGNAQKLEAIDIYACKVRHLPKSVKKLKKLEYFNIYNNYMAIVDYEKWYKDDVFRCKEIYDYSDIFFTASNKYFFK